MTGSLRFVDSISATPTTLLDLNAGAWDLQDEGTEFPPPPLKLGIASTLLTDGAIIPASAYDLRTISLSWVLKDATADDTATELQALYRQLNKPSNILRWHEFTTHPVFFRTFRTSPTAVRRRGDPDGTSKRVSVEILAEPFAYGLKETLPAVTVNNDPAAPANGCFFDIDSATPSNANPYFETDVSNWTGINGASLSRSTAQAHEGVASMLLTPNGVTADPRAQSEVIVVAEGDSLFASGWLRSPGTPTVGVTIRWYSDAAGSTLISETGPLSAISANTWTPYWVTGVAPAGAIRARIAPRYQGTPAAGTTLFVDEAILGPSQGIKGDVPTPLFAIVSAGVVVNGYRTSVIATRRRGTPSAAPFVLQAESLSLGIDTTLPGNDAAMSGAGSNYARTSFATQAGMATRLSGGVAGPYHPASPSVDARGRYRIFSRHRKSVAGDDIKVRLNLTSNGLDVTGPTITLPTHAGTTSRFYMDLGVFNIPMGYDPVADGFSSAEIPTHGVYVQLQAERAAGTGNLDTDLLLWVPADDSLAFIIWTQTSGATDLVMDGAANQVYARGTTGQVRTHEISRVISRLPMISPGLPNRIFFVRDVGATNNGGDSISGTTQLTPYYWPRYLSVRPAST